VRLLSHSVRDRVILPQRRKRKQRSSSDRRPVVTSASRSVVDVEDPIGVIGEAHELRPIQSMRDDDLPALDISSSSCNVPSAASSLRAGAVATSTCDRRHMWG
jgi:hypothetical protein